MPKGGCTPIFLPKAPGGTEPKGKHWSVGFSWRERKRKWVNGQAWDMFNLYMFFYDKWVVSVKKKKSYNVEEDLIILWRCRNVGQLTMSDRVSTLCPPLNQSLATLGCKCHRFRKTTRWESLQRGFLTGEKHCVLVALLFTVQKSLRSQTC